MGAGASMENPDDMGPVVIGPDGHPRSMPRIRIVNLPSQSRPRRLPTYFCHSCERSFTHMGPPPRRNGPTISEVTTNNNNGNSIDSDNNDNNNSNTTNATRNAPTNAQKEQNVYPCKCMKCIQIETTKGGGNKGGQRSNNKSMLPKRFWRVC